MSCIELNEHNFVLVFFESSQHLVSAYHIDFPLIFRLVESHSKSICFNSNQTSVFHSFSMKINEGWGQLKFFFCHTQEHRPLHLLHVVFFNLLESLNEILTVFMLLLIG